MTANLLQMQHSCNASALLAKTVAYHHRKQEFSAPEVVSYLMGWGDHYISHPFQTIHWNSVTVLLKQSFPFLRDYQVKTCTSTQDSHVTVDKRSPETKYISVEIHKGNLHIHDQVWEYVDHGYEFEQLSYLECFLNTYDIRSAANMPLVHKKAGPWFPSTNNSNSRPFYSASMLALLKPWQDIQMLKKNEETFEMVFSSFMASAPQKVQTIVGNIQYFHNCADQVKCEEEKMQLTHNFNYALVPPGEHLDDTCDDSEGPAGQSTEHCLEWQHYITEADSPSKETHHTEVSTGGVMSTPSSLSIHPSMQLEISAGERSTDESKSSPFDPPSHLNKEQSMAFIIITEHIYQILTSKDPLQLLMVIHGPGGTGKTQLLKAITKMFSDIGIPVRLEGKLYTPGVLFLPAKEHHAVICGSIDRVHKLLADVVTAFHLANTRTMVDAPFTGLSVVLLVAGHNRVLYSQHPTTCKFRKFKSQTRYGLTF
ncbi:uncharacterized protein BJ212DRAFT_1296415 [Suillus subaureus]|uniref:DNA helicase n=1 Tax=Suillus subaureus TaxID=48587 RepID=A0A9P7EKM4_9AGAM|nr:uncharacterized protein BJ212DRAFT_1296415 [Suillus subaureus]KAG1823894.1 hypothetical protein BJ212DRAFT_1296415 [Suillus subaureus]